MSTIAEELTRIQAAKADIKTAIEEKGVTVGTDKIDTYANKIRMITGGGGSDKEYVVLSKELVFEDGWLKSDGTAYIDTGILVDESIEVEIKVELINTTSWSCIIGGRGSGTGYYFDLNTQGSSESTTLRYNIANTFRKYKDTGIFNRNTVIKIKYNSPSIVNIDGIDKNGSLYSSNTGNLFGTIAIFALQINGEVTSDMKYPYKIYYVKIKKQNKEYYFVPKKVNNVAGFLDIINNKFYGPANGGTFSIQEAKLYSETVVSPEFAQIKTDIVNALVEKGVETDNSLKWTDIDDKILEIPSYWEGTQAEYDALTDKTKYKIYGITE